jgi:hypothetical protein
MITPLISRSIFTVVLTSQLSLCVFGQAVQNPSPAPVAPTAEAPDILDHWRRATVALGQVATIGGVQKFVTLGSGVLVADKTHAALLTAKHMVLDSDIGFFPTQLSMRLPKTEPSAEVDFGVIVPLVVNGRNIWITSTAPSDLAIIPLPDLSKYKNIHAVGLQDFGTPEDIFQGASVIVLGYPGILGDTYQTAPIARGGLIAWIDPDDPINKPFLVDANIFGGNSGGPVFRLRNGFDKHGTMVLVGGISFIGIVSQDAKEYSDVVVTDNATYAQKIRTPNPLTGVPNDVEAVVKNIGGIGVIEPVSRARKLVEEVFQIPHSSQ